MGQTLQDEVAIVTGAGRGFGAAIAKGLAANGAQVALVSRTRAELDRVADDIRAHGGRACVAIADVTNRDDVARAAKTAKDAFGPVTILVNNAGLAGPFGPVGVVDPDAWWAAQAVHLRGPLLFMSAVLPGMRARKRGHIINIASRGGNEVTAHLSAYGVGKSSEIRLTQHVGAENKEFGVAAFVIEPGTTITEMAESTIASPEAQKWVPWMVDVLGQLKRDAPDPAPVFARCVEMCVSLASGKYDALSGRYLEPADDFDALLRAQP